MNLHPFAYFGVQIWSMSFQTPEEFHSCHHIIPSRNSISLFWSGFSMNIVPEAKWTRKSGSPCLLGNYPSFYPLHAWMFLQNSTKRKMSFMPGIFASIFLIFPPACSLASCSWFCHSLACANALQSMFLKNLEKKKKGFFPHFAVRVRGYRGIFAAQIIVLLLVNSWPHSFINTDEKAQLEKKKQHHCWRKKRKRIYSQRAHHFTIP